MAARRCRRAFPTAATCRSRAGPWSTWTVRPAECWYRPAAPRASTGMATMAAGAAASRSTPSPPYGASQAETVDLNGGGKADLLFTAPPSCATILAWRRRFRAARARRAPTAFPAATANTEQTSVVSPFWQRTVAPCAPTAKRPWPAHGRYGQRRLLAARAALGAAMSATRVYFADGRLRRADIVTPPSTICWCSATKAATVRRWRAPLPLRLSPTDQISFSDIRGNGTTAIVITRVSPEVETCAPIPSRPSPAASPFAGVDRQRPGRDHHAAVRQLHALLSGGQAAGPLATRPPSPCRWSRRCAAPMRSPRLSFTRCYAYRDGYLIRWRGSVASAWWRAGTQVRPRRHAGRQLADGARGRRAARTDANPDLVLPGRS